MIEKRLSEIRTKYLSAARVLLGAMVRYPEETMANLQSIHLEWFRDADAETKKAAQAYFSISKKHVFSVYSIDALDAAPAEWWADVQMECGDLDLHAAIDDFLSIYRRYIESIISAQTLGAWSDLEGGALFSVQSEYRKNSKAYPEQLSSDEFDNWFRAKMERGYVQSKLVNPFPSVARAAMLHSFEPGDMVLVAGRPGRGKTHFCLDLINYWLLEGYAGVFVCLDMSPIQLKMRMLTRMTGISPYYDWRLLDESDRAALALAKKQIDAFNLSLTIESNLSRVIDVVRSTSYSEKIDFVVIDYVQLMSVPNSKGYRVNDLEEITRQLRNLAKQLNIVVICAAQLNRAIAEHESPALHHLRGSGSLEQDASIVFGLHQRVDEVQGTVFEVHVLKNQRGPTPSEPIQLNFSGIHGWSDPAADKAERANGVHDEKVPF
jgi:KaiC/GvpD/RAD55 family RecA-like ATPase